MISRHAEQRCHSRGVRPTMINTILDHADIERPIGDNCRLYRLSRNAAKQLNLGDKLGRFAVIWSDDTQRVVTVMPIHEGHAGARYRGRH